MVIDENSNVGVGNTSPSARLDVSTTATGQVLRLNAASQTFGHLGKQWLPRLSGFLLWRYSGCRCGQFGWCCTPGYGQYY